MSAGFGAALPQNVLPNQPVIFTDNTCPCTQGLVFKKSGGVFLLASNAPSNNSNCACGCRRIYLTIYEVEVHANILLPTGGTPNEEIRLAIAVDGVIDPESIMSFVPTAVLTDIGNVGTEHPELAEETLGVTAWVTIPARMRCVACLITSAADFVIILTCRKMYASRRKTLCLG